MLRIPQSHQLHEPCHLGVFNDKILKKEQPTKDGGLVKQPCAIEHVLVPSLKLTAKAPENGGLEYDCFLFGMAYFQGRLLLVSGSVTIQKKLSFISG